MIIVICLVAGLLLRVGAGGRISDMAHVKLHGETVLLVLLAVQAMAPLLHVTGVAARAAFYAWLATFLLMSAIAWLNRRSPGMPALGLGLLLNFTVIVLNGGMPVFGSAAAAAGASPHAALVPSTDFIHVLGTAATRLPFLADAVPIPGPGWLRSVASPGDLLLFVGIVSFLAASKGIHGAAISTSE